MTLGTPLDWIDCHASTWHALLETGPALSHKSPLASVLCSYIRQQRWYRDKSSRHEEVAVVEVVPLAQSVHLLVVRMTFSEGEASEYCVPVVFFKASASGENEAPPEHAVIAGVRAEGASGFLLDATNSPLVPTTLLETILNRRQISGKESALVGRPEAELAPEQRGVTRDVRPLSGEQSNTNYQFEEKYLLKLLRKLEPGTSLEIEILGHLARVCFPNAPRLLGTLELRSKSGASSSVGILQAFVQNQGDAWRLANESAALFVRTLERKGALPALPKMSVFDAQEASPPPELSASENEFFPRMELLGQRTAELHRALCFPEVPDFRPETWGEQARCAHFQTLMDLATRTFFLIRRSQDRLAPQDAELARAVLGTEQILKDKIRAIFEGQLSGALIRVHGDLHLGQVLVTADDFVFVDFEGEPARPVADRKRKRSPLADVAGMLRSFHYAAHSQFLGPDNGDLNGVNGKVARDRAEVWQFWVGARFLKGYLNEISSTGLLPSEPQEVQRLLEGHLLEKTLYEVVYELANRPAWVGIPLRALVSLNG